MGLAFLLLLRGQIQQALVAGGLGAHAQHAGGHALVHHGLAFGA
jgi:hypothetical protein